MTAKVDHKDAFRQPPVCDAHKMLAVATLEGPNSSKVRGFSPQTQLSGEAAAVLRNEAVLGATATIAAGWLQIPRLGCFGDFGAVATESAIHTAPAAFTERSEILGFELTIETSLLGYTAGMSSGNVALCGC